ncbi:NmrA family transcriptional regulator [Streptomyces sp. CS159]|uniref:NAD(P)H-binding protein n=1 Tax=Streptomyces sp. CS159 TaxID=1982762 RepID=UPI000B41D0F2|nr:NAD(P)H-binding protein [Streptomyces sp. CS159]OWA22264.1 NmrA family transcriptional regulator [Streptomyces sp. CS159]
MIVITTPTGGIGRQVLDRVLDALDTRDDGATLRVIAREPGRLTARARERAEVFQGSHADPDVLAAACEGACQVFWLVPPAPGADSVEGHFRDFTLPLCDVIARQGLPRVVAVSSLGRGVAKDAGPISASLAMDDRIAATGVHYRALCPPFLMENLLGQTAALRDTGEFRMAYAADRVLRTCATADIAATAARLLLDDSWTGRADVPLVGPDDLTPEGMAGVLSDVLGRPVRVRETTPEAYKASALRFGASESGAQGLADMASAMDAQGFYGAAEPSTPDTAPTSFRRWCEEVLRPATLA